jgi:hypothetical protein
MSTLPNTTKIYRLRHQIRFMRTLQRKRKNHKRDKICKAIIRREEAIKGLINSERKLSWAEVSKEFHITIHGLKNPITNRRAGKPTNFSGGMKARSCQSKTI